MSKRYKLTSKDQENKDLTRQFEAKEAGVAELFEFYARVEPVYIAASKVLEEGNSITTSNKANTR